MGVTMGRDSGRKISSLFQCLFSILVFAVFLSGCSGLLGEEVEPILPAAAEFTFEQYEVVTGLAKRQTVLTGSLLGGAIAELAVVNIDEKDDHRLRIYAFGDGTWVPRLDATLGPEVLFVDMANIGGRDRLVTYEPGRLNWFDPDSATERSLVAVTANFNPPRSGEIPHVDVTRDVNGDERDDLVVPDVYGFWVFIQRSDGAFADPVKLGPSRRMTIGPDGYRHNPWDQGGVHEMDYNRDGRSDLVFWNEDPSRFITRTSMGYLPLRPRPSLPMWPSTPVIRPRSRLHRGFAVGVLMTDCPETQRGGSCTRSPT